MPRTPEQNNLIKGKRKNRLLEVALYVFATQGYDSVAIDDITAKAKCSHGLFYHYFSTKEEVFAAVISKYIVGNPHVLPLKEAREIGGYEGILHIIRGSEMFDEMTDSDILANVVAFSLPNSRKISYLPDGVDPKDYDFAANFGILAKQAQEEGRCIDGDPEHIGLAAFDIVFGYLSRRTLLGKNQKCVMAEVLRNLVTK